MQHQSSIINPIQSNPIQSNPIINHQSSIINHQSNHQSIQSNPIQSNPIIEPAVLMQHQSLFLAMPSRSTIARRRSSARLPSRLAIACSPRWHTSSTMPSATRRCRLTLTLLAPPARTSPSSTDSRATCHCGPIVRRSSSARLRGRPTRTLRSFSTLCCCSISILHRSMSCHRSSLCSLSLVWNPHSRELPACCFVVDCLEWHHR